MESTESPRGASPAVRRTLDRAVSGREISRADGERLFRAEGADLAALLAAADEVRRQRVGERVSFTVNRNINFTNVCYMGCRFCNFSQRKDSLAAEFLSVATVLERAQQAWDRGATEVCIQGGLHPDLPASYYRDLVAGIKARLPGMHVHAFSPFEIWFAMKKGRKSAAQVLAELKDAGLGSVPGTAAEILDREVRRLLTRDKLSATEWESIIRAAHGVGLPSTATIMYGHVDGPAHWAAHIDRIRRIQKDTGGFTEFIPLGFIHYDTELFRDTPGVRPGPTTVEHRKMHAVARLMLSGWIDNIQASWTKLGPELASQMLHCGANDLGGTLMNESIARSAGARYGQEITPAEMVRLIRAAGREPVRRDTLYGVLEEYADHDPAETEPLVSRAAEPSGVRLSVATKVLAVASVS